MCLNLKTFVKMVKLLSLAANLGYIPRVQKPGPRPTALAWLWLSKNSGRAKAHPRPKVRPGFWPQAGASTSLTTTVAVSPTSTMTMTMVAGSPTTMTTVCCVTHVNNDDDVGDAATVVSTNDGDNHLEPPSLYLFPSCTLCHKLILLLPFFILLKSLHISYQMNMESIYFYW